MRLTILLICIASICQAQVSGNFKQVRLLNNVDSIGLGSTTGILRYDPVTGKYRFYNALTSTWFTPAIGRFWPLSGTGGFGGNVSIDGNDFNLDFFDHGNVTWLGNSTGQFTVNDFITIDLIGSGTNFSVGNNQVTIIGPAVNFVTTDGFTPINSFNLVSSSNGTVESNANLQILSGSATLITAGTGATMTGTSDFNFGLANATIYWEWDGANNGKFTGRQSFTGSSTLPPVNILPKTGAPSTRVNGDLWYDDTSTDRLMARIDGADVNLGGATIGGSIAATQVAFGSAGNTISGEAAFNYDATNNILDVDILQVGVAVDPGTVTNGQFFYSTGHEYIGQKNGTPINFVTSGTLTNNRITFANGPANVTGETALQWDATNDELEVGNGSSGKVLVLGGNSVTSVLPGEIQLDDIIASDAITLNYSTLLASGQADFTVSNSSGTVTVSSSGATFLHNTSASLLITTNGSTQSANFNTGGISWASLTNAADISISFPNGISGDENAGNVTITGGNGFASSGNGNGANITVTSGERRVAGSGVDGNLIFNSRTGNTTFSAATFSVSTPAGGVTVDADARFYGTDLHNNSAGITGTTNQYIGSGTYTPTSTNIANVSASTPGVAQYIRVGNVVTVSGVINATVTTTGVITRVELTLPIGSALTNDHQVAGVVVSGAGPPVTDIKGGHVEAEVTSNNAELIFGAGDTGAAEYFYTYTYVIL